MTITSMPIRCRQSAGREPSILEARAFDLYHKSDLFLLPSVGECFGIASVEAMGAGLPVIASNVGATAEIIESGRNGFVVLANDGAELGAAITSILENAARREDMGRQSRILAKQRFDLETNARRTLDYLKQISTPRPIPQLNKI